MDYYGYTINKKVKKMANSINYGNKMHRAMRELISEVLSDVASDGLPGNHHFFITFNSQYPSVEMADWLLEKHPEEMTVVIQNWFDKLRVHTDFFEITLNFGDHPEHLSIPFDSVKSFVDPSVEFGLRFEENTDKNEEQLDKKESIETNHTEGVSKVIKLDNFRK